MAWACRRKRMRSHSRGELAELGVVQTLVWFEPAKTSPILWLLLLPPRRCCIELGGTLSDSQADCSQTEVRLERAIARASEERFSRSRRCPRLLPSPAILPLPLCFPCFRNRKCQHRSAEVSR